MAFIIGVITIIGTIYFLVQGFKPRPAEKKPFPWWWMNDWWD